MTETQIDNRYDIVYLFDVTDGNPNGDPDAGNLPRIDPETGQGLITDVCLKRKIRNFVALTHEGLPPYEIYVQEKAVLNNQHQKSYVNLYGDEAKTKQSKGKLPKETEEAFAITKWMCKNFFDIRTFGAVMTTGVNCGQVRGPIQLTLARSIDPIVSAEHSITRCAVTTQAEADKQQGDNRTMGRKFTVPYGLYRMHGFINAKLAQQTGFGPEDLELVKRSFNEMFEHDRSAARGLMTPVACIAFRHDCALGNARADELFRHVHISLRPEVAASQRPPRSFDDYRLMVEEADLPAGITVEWWVKAPVAVGV